MPLSARLSDPLHDIVAVLSRELSTNLPGQQTILDRLLDVLLVLAFRTAFAQSHDAPRWFHAATDPRLRPALQAMHQDAGRPWTVPELAATSGLSRAAFAIERSGVPTVLTDTPSVFATDLLGDERGHASLRAGQ